MKKNDIVAKILELKLKKGIKTLKEKLQIQKLQQKLENLIVSNIYLNEHLNPKMIDKDFVDVERYEIKNYIDIGEFKKNDINLE